MPTDTTIIDRLRADATTLARDAARYIELLHAELAAAHAARDAAERTSEGRLRQLWRKEEEARQEWTRAENASAVRDALMEKLATALRERDEARAALEAARYSCDHEGVCLLIDTKPDGTR